MPGTSPLLRRIAAWGLVVAVLVVVYGVVVAPLVQAHQRLDAQRARTEDLLAGFARIANAGAGTEDRLDALQSSQAASGLYLDGETQAQAGAGLQERLIAMIRSNGGTVKSSEAIPSNTQDHPRRLTVRIQFAAYLRNIQKVLHGLEGGRPALLIESLEVTNRRGRKSSQNSKFESILSVRMDVIGYLRPELP